MNYSLIISMLAMRIKSMIYLKNRSTLRFWQLFSKYLTFL